MLNTTTCAAPLLRPIATSRQWLASDGRRGFGNGRGKPRNNRLFDAPFASQPSRLATLPAFSSGPRAFPLAREYEQSGATAPVLSSHADPPHLRPGTFW